MGPAVPRAAQGTFCVLLEFGEKQLSDERAREFASDFRVLLFACVFVVLGSVAMWRMLNDMHDSRHQTTITHE